MKLQLWFTYCLIKYNILRMPPFGEWQCLFPTHLDPFDNFIYWTY